MMSVYYKVVNFISNTVLINIVFSGSFPVKKRKITSIFLGNTIYIILENLSQVL